MSVRERLEKTGIETESLLDFVLQRRNKDGGFAFVHPLPSSIPETYYATFILMAINEQIEDAHDLENFLMAKLKSPNVYTCYFAVESLDIIGRMPRIELGWLEKKLQILRRLRRYGAKGVLGGESGTTATYSFEMPNLLENVFYISKILYLSGVKMSEKTIDFVKSFKSRGGGFGVTNANLKDTFYALSCLGLANHHTKYRKTREFLAGHQHPGGGFVQTVGSYPPYIEDTFFGLGSLREVKGQLLYREETLDMISRLQNPDGGFRRSIYGGIGTLEYSYYAIASLSEIYDMMLSVSPSE